MSKKKFSLKSMYITLLAAVVIAGFSSCASKSDVSDLPPEEQISEADLLDNSEKATPVVDSDVFADLDPKKTEEIAKSLTTSEDGKSAPMVEGAPFYNPIGGESLGRVAYTLYGSRSSAKKLLEKNPELRGVARLSANQYVYFDFDGLKPQPRFLTKDLLDRYPSQLAESLISHSDQAGLSKTVAVVEQGETLQQLSQRLYGTTRYWTEIYLLNRDHISHYDRVQAGTKLTVYSRMAVATPKVETPKVWTESPKAEDAAQPVMPSETMAQMPAEPQESLDSPLANQPQAAAPAPAVDPIPETPSQPEAAATPAPEETPAQVTPAPESSNAFASNPNLRRAVYIGLILLIALVAFYMTRPSKKQKFDMLDVTTNEVTGRQKVPGKGKDNQQGLG